MIRKHIQTKKNIYIYIYINKKNRKCDKKVKKSEKFKKIVNKQVRQRKVKVAKINK